MKKLALAQATIEYLILAAVISILLAAWLDNLFPAIRDNLKTTFFDVAVEKIINE